MPYSEKSNYLHKRQSPPQRFDKSTFKTVPVSHTDYSGKKFDKPGVKAVVGKVKTTGKWEIQSFLVPKKSYLKKRMAKGGLAEETTISQIVARIAKKNNTTAYDVIEKIKEGAKHELEHADTIEYIKKHPYLSKEKGAELIAIDHIDKDGLGYYPELEKADGRMDEGGLLKIDDYELSKETAIDFEYDIVRAISGKEFSNKPYFIKNKILYRIKDHTPDWMNFADDVENNRNFDKIINVTIGNYEDSDYRRNKSTMEQFNKEYPQIKTVDIIINDGDSLINSINKIKNFAGKNDDNTFEPGGEIKGLNKDKPVSLDFYPTTKEHAKEYGIIAKNPLFLKTIYVKKEARLSGLGKHSLMFLDNYAMDNNHDVIFGYISQKAEFTKDSRITYFDDISLIKQWLSNNGYAVNEQTNDFHKVIINTMAKGGNISKDGKRGGLLHGKTDKGNAEGIKTEVVETGQQIIMGGGEIVVPTKVVNDTETYTFKNKTNIQVIDYLMKKHNCRSVIKKGKARDDSEKSDGKPVKVLAGSVVVNENAVNDKELKDFSGTAKEILNQINTSTGGREIMESGGNVSENAKKFFVKSNFGHWSVIDKSTNKMIVGYSKKEQAQKTADGLNAINGIDELNKMLETLKTKDGYGHFARMESGGIINAEPGIKNGFMAINKDFAVFAFNQSPKNNDNYKQAINLRVVKDELEKTNDKELFKFILNHYENGTFERFDKQKATSLITDKTQIAIFNQDGIISISDKMDDDVSIKKTEKEVFDKGGRIIKKTVDNIEISFVPSNEIPRAFDMFIGDEKQPHIAYSHSEIPDVFNKWNNLRVNKMIDGLKDLKLSNGGNIISHEIKEMYQDYRSKKKKPTIDEIKNALQQTDLKPEIKEVLYAWEGEGSVKGGESKTGILHEFFTPYWLCKAITDIAKKLHPEAKKFLEPAMGTGRFLRYLDDNSDVTGFEVNELNFKISKKIYPTAKIYNQAFETAFLSPPRFNSTAKESWVGKDFDMVLSNPPYGGYSGEYKGYMPKIYTRFECLFIYLSMKLVKPGGYGIFVLPQSFMNNGNMYNQMKEDILKTNAFVDAVRLPNGIFASTDIGVDIVIFQKK